MEWNQLKLVDTVGLEIARLEFHTHSVIFLLLQ